MTAALWYTISYSCVGTVSGVTITAKTDVPVHLWVRITNSMPRIHHDPVMKRGVLWRLMPRYCFTTFTDIEQEEAGDTLEHTFLITDWPVCEWRWFYFYGTISAETVPSTSAVFACRRQPVGAEYTFRIEAHPELSSIDGYVQHFQDSTPWGTLVDAPGTHSNDSATTMWVQFASMNPPNTYRYIFRAPCVWDTSSLPPGTVILEAKVSVYLWTKSDDGNYKPALNVYASNPASENALVPHDYATFDSVPLSDNLEYDDIVLYAWHMFTLNAAGRAAINPGGATKLGFRESKYDAPRISPTWVLNTGCKIEFLTADFSPGARPYLILTTSGAPCP